MVKIIPHFIFMRTKKLIIRSKNTSCKALKSIEVPYGVIYRMGSTTPTNAITHKEGYFEINSPTACANSNDKIVMKQLFVAAGVPTAEYIIKTPEEDIQIFKDLAHEKLKEWKRIIIKHKHSSKGNNIYFIETEEDLEKWFQTYNRYENYVFEKYYTYSKEYRLHITNDGCFYTCRKMLKNNADVRWHRHESNSVWILEENPAFDKPLNWNDIVDACIAAKNAVGLDIAAVDVKVQTKKESPKFIILETNSAPALGAAGIIQYTKMLKKMIDDNKERFS